MPALSSQEVAGEAPGVILSLLRYWRSSLLLVLAAAALGFGVSLLLPERYEAYAELGLTDPRGANVFAQNNGVLPEDLERYTIRQQSLVLSTPTLERTRERLDFDVSVDELYDRISVSGDDAGVIGVLASAPTAGEAQSLADAVAGAYGDNTRAAIREEVASAVAAIDESRRQVVDDLQAAQRRLDADPRNAVLQRQVESAVAALDALNTRVNEVQVNGAAFDDGLEYVLRARRPERPTEPQPLRNAAVAGLLGLVLAGVVAWIRADRDRAADEAGAPEQVLGAPMLGAVPDLPSSGVLAALDDPASAATEAYQFATASLQYVFHDGVVLVTSAGRGDGKTVSAASIAAVAARDGSRVILVDADARSHGLTRRLLGAAGEDAPGLTDLADGSARWEGVVRSLVLADDVLLPFVPGGTTAGTLASLYRTKAMADAVARLRESYDLVVVDCPALLAVADVASLAAHADGIVLVVSRRTPIKTLEAVSSRLELIPAPLVGYVFTRADAEEVGGSYGPGVRLPWHVVPGGRRTRKERRDLQVAAATGPSTNGASSRRRGGRGLRGRRRETAGRRAERESR